MSTVTSPAEGTPGAAITKTNTGATRDIDTLSGIANFVTAWSNRGATSIQGSGAGQVIWNVTGSKVLERGYLYLPATGLASDRTVGAIYYTTAIRGVQLILTGSNLFPRLQTQGSQAALINQATGSTGVAGTTGIRYQIFGDAGTSPTTGSCRAAIYIGDSLTPWWDSGLITGVDTAGSSGAFAQARFITSTDWYLDDFGFKDAADAVWFPWTANSAPTVNIAPTTQSPAAGGAFSATATATDDGSIASYAWSVVSASSTATPTLTGATTANVSGTAPAAGNVVTLQATVTDDGGLTATDTAEVRVPIAGSATGVPLALDGTSKVGTWTRAGAATTDGAALADALDTTYLETGALSATEQSARFRLQPSAARSSGKFTLRLGTDTGTGTALVKLYEGNTLRQSWTQAITSTATDYDFTFDAGTITAVTDWGNLYLGIGFTS